MAKQTKKRPREPTINIEEKKKMGPKGKAGEGLIRWMRHLYVYDENDGLVGVPLHLRLLLLEKRGTMLCA